MGFPDGEFVYFDRTGHLVSREYYEKGKFVKSILGDGSTEQNSEGKSE